MPRYETHDIRNIALVGNLGVGKTSLLEALAFAAGEIRQKGTVSKGTTLGDHLPQEHAHQHSLQPAIINLDVAGRHLNLIDTPGAPDLMGRVLAILPAVETVAVVINAQTGPDFAARRLLDCAAQRGLDRLLIINGIDAPGADLAGCLKQVQAAFGAQCLPLNLPAAGGQQVVDCYFAPDGSTTDFSSVAEAHSRLVDQVIEVDEQLMESYLERGQEPSPERLHDPFEAVLRGGQLVPVCFTSAETGAGVAELLRAFTELMPNPTEGTPPIFQHGDGANAVPVQFTADPGRHVLAHVFKLTIDPFVGRLAVFRLHQGTITKDSQLFIGEARKPFRVGHLLKVHGKDTREIDTGIPGDICAVAKIDGIEFGTVLHDSHDEDHIHLPALEFPAPMQALAIKAKSRGDEQKISDALHKLQAEDPSIRIESNHNLNETVLHALGELHLRVLLEDLKARFHVEVVTSPPKIPYRETITVPAEGHYRHKKQTGGAGQFGEVFLRVQPLPRGAGFRFVDAVVGGAIPRQFLPAVEKGVRQVLASGVVAGYEMQDIEVTVYDGKFHAVDSKEVAFVSAGKKAFIAAIQQARPVVLEPIVNLAITAPHAHIGDITRDLTGKRARINNTTAQPAGLTAISAQVPLRELNGYQSQMKSLTGGTGSFEVVFDHYEPLPGKAQADLVAAYRPLASDD